MFHFLLKKFAVSKKFAYLCIERKFQLINFRKYDNEAEKGS